MRRIMKKWSRAALTLLLTCSMVFGLAACGGKSNNNANEEAKKYVYRYEDLNLNLTEGNQSIYAYTYTNDRFYLLLVENFWDELTGMVVTLKSFKEDGSDVQTMELINSLQENPDYMDYNTPDISIDSDMFIDPGFGIEDNMSVDVGVPEEDAEEDEPEETVPPEEKPLYDEESETSDMPAEDAEQEVPEDDTDTNERVYRDVYMGSYGLDNSGVYFVLYDNSYMFDANGYYMPLENKRTICSYGLDGTLRMERDLSEDEYFSYILGDSQGNLVLIDYGTQMIIMDTQGNQLKKENLDFGGGWMQNAFINKDGNVSLVVVDGDYTKLTLQTYNLQTLSFEDDIELPGVINNYGRPVAGLNYDMILSNSNGLFGYNIGDEEPVQILSYINSDIDYSYVQTPVEMDENHLITVSRDPQTWESSLGILTYVPPEEVPDKQAILLACNYLGWDLRERIIKFNRESEQYRIVVEIYSQYNTMDDYSAGVTRLNNDIVSGKVPDILVMDSNMPIESYISKGVLADIGKLIEADEEMNWDDFMTNVFDAYSVKGKLYSVIPSFTVSTVLGKSSIVGDEPGMTVADLQALMKQYPNASVFGETMTRSSMLWYVMMYSGSTYINRDTGKCSFDSEEFISMLEFLNQFPEEFDYESNPDYWMNYESSFRENKTLLMDYTLYNLSDFGYTAQGYFGEPVTFIGFPNDSASMGAVIQAQNQYGIGARSANKEGAWEFLRYYLTPEYQESIWYLPVLKEALFQQMEHAKERPYWEDAEGNKEYYDNYYWINGEQILINPLTEEEADALYEYVSSVNMAYYYDDGLSEIITEEVDAYFLGQKTAEEVAEIIQSRAQVYINESR